MNFPCEISRSCFGIFQRYLSSTKQTQKTIRKEEKHKKSIRNGLDCTTVCSKAYQNTKIHLISKKRDF